jgi:DNA-binding IclR family transcriptional regulator
MPRTNEPGAGVLERATRLLDAFDTKHLTLSLAELTARSGLAHATASRITASLIEVGLLSRSADGRYSIGAKARDLGLLVPSSASVRSVALPYMHDLHAALHQHVQLLALGRREAVILERISAPDAVIVISDVGGHLPLHASAGGKVLLAHSPADLQKEVLGGPLEQLTPRTVTSPRILAEQLEQCRHSGLMIAREEVSLMASSVAARVLDESGQVVAAVSVVVRAGTAAVKVAVPAVATTALAISRRLGWAGRRGDMRPARGAAARRQAAPRVRGA